MSQIDLNALEKKAQAATPGPWMVFDKWMDWEAPVVHSGAPNSESFMLIALLSTYARPLSESNAAFIAACSPDVILVLVERVKKTEAHDMHFERLVAENAVLVARVRTLEETLKWIAGYTCMVKDVLTPETCQCPSHTAQRVLIPPSEPRDG